MLRIAANEQANALQEETEEGLVGFGARSNVALKTGKKKQVCCACAFVLFLSGDIPRSARCSLVEAILPRIPPVM